MFVFEWLILKASLVFWWTVALLQGKAVPEWRTNISERYCGSDFGEVGLQDAEVFGFLFMNLYYLLYLAFMLQLGAILSTYLLVWCCWVLGRIAWFIFDSYYKVRHARQTIEDSLFSIELYDKVGLLGNDEEALDMVSYHSRLLTAHLGTSFDLLYFYQGFPRRCAAALVGKNLQAVLREIGQNGALFCQSLTQWFPTVAFTRCLLTPDTNATGISWPKQSV